MLHESCVLFSIHTAFHLRLGCNFPNLIGRGLAEVCWRLVLLEAVTGHYIALANQLTGLKKLLLIWFVLVAHVYKLFGTIFTDQNSRLVLMTISSESIRRHISCSGCCGTF